MLTVLLGLGTWQLYRLAWKEGILAEIASAEAAQPTPLGFAPKPFAKVSVTGRLLFDHAAQFGAEVRDTSTGPTMGFYQIVPLERDGASTILVNRGWVPQQRQAALAEPSGLVTVTGYVRSAETHHWFSPADNMPERQFYTLDPAIIGAAVGIPNPAPLTLVAMGPARPGSYPVPAQHLPRPPNNHLSYAITWYGLALALVIIFAIWFRKALRS
jgi:surfeit locus 1 family protein